MQTRQFISSAAGYHRAQLNGVIVLNPIAAGEQLVPSNDQHGFGHDLEVSQEVAHQVGAGNGYFPFRVAEDDLQENSNDPKLIASVSTMEMTTSQTTTLTNFSFRMCPHFKSPILICMNLLQRGLTNSFRGLRTGDANLFALGAAMLMFVWWRSSKPSRARVYRKKLRPGDAVTIRFNPRQANDA